MLLLVLLVLLALALAILAVRRAVPIAAASAAAWAVWTFTRDPLATCLAGIAVLLFLISLIDSAATASSQLLRLSARGVDFIAGVSAAVFLAWSFGRAFGADDQSPEQLGVICFSGAMIGSALVASRYRVAH